MELDLQEEAVACLARFLNMTIGTLPSSTVFLDSDELEGGPASGGSTSASCGLAASSSSLLSPPRHADNMLRTVDYPSCMKRGWCRTGRFCNTLTQNTSYRILFVESTTDVANIGVKDYICAAPGLGHFTHGGSDAGRD